MIHSFIQEVLSNSWGHSGRGGSCPCVPSSIFQWGGWDHFRQPKGAGERELGALGTRLWDCDPETSSLSSPRGSPPPASFPPWRVPQTPRIPRWGPGRVTGVLKSQPPGPGQRGWPSGWSPLFLLVESPKARSMSAREPQETLLNRGSFQLRTSPRLAALGETVAPFISPRGAGWKVRTVPPRPLRPRPCHQA